MLIFDFDILELEEEIDVNGRGWKQVFYLGFSAQSFDIAIVAIIHKRKEPNLDNRHFLESYYVFHKLQELSV